MFDFFSWQHLSIMLVVALVVVGPKDLPRLMNMAGKWAAKARGMAGEFRRSFDEMARESELAELRKEIDDLKKNNPVTEVANSLSGVQADVSLEGAGVAAEPVAPPEPRSGEFQVTESAPRPAPQPASETSS
ncbi:MAG TPA: Sec-independent protein translocase protein TatB [Rhizomicrobium sp.]|jgi:sec-independent protein translocase protein TatB|nr:Sec-independent protein translocase protein TatB [Rhizomicrobium sp.]